MQIFNCVFVIILITINLFSLSMAVPISRTQSVRYSLYNGIKISKKFLVNLIEIQIICR